MLKNKNILVILVGIFALLNLGAIAIIFLKLNRLETSVVTAVATSGNTEESAPGEQTASVPVEVLNYPLKEI